MTVKCQPHKFHVEPQQLPDLGNAQCSLNINGSAIRDDLRNQFPV